MSNAGNRSVPDPNRPTGSACFDCGDLHHEGFGRLTFAEFAVKCDTDKDLQNAVMQAESSKRGAPQSWVAGECFDWESEVVDVRQSCQILNEEELRKAMKVAKLPKNMKSIPSMKVPMSSVAC